LTDLFGLAATKLEHLEVPMRVLLSIAILCASALPAFAQDADNTVPEPGVLSLIGIGAGALLLAYRRKK
jgi:hypothetical protein